MILSISARTTSETVRRMHVKTPRLFNQRRERLSPLRREGGEKGAHESRSIRWLTGHSQETLDEELAKNTSFEDFFAQAPQINPSRSLITGVVCGVRVEDIEEPTMREIRYLDKLIDELAKGKAIEKILRK